MKLKGSTPFHAVPLLELDGQATTQSNTINKLVGTLAGRYPDNALAAARYFADDRLTVADLKVFLWIRSLRAGVLDHIPATLADRIAPGLVAHRVSEIRASADPLRLAAICRSIVTQPGPRHTHNVRGALEGEALYSEIARILAGYLDASVRRAWIIGSEARGTAVEGADVDIALRGPGPIDLGILASIRAELEELPTIRSFDLADLGRATDRFVQESLAISIVLPLGEATPDHVEG